MKKIVEMLLEKGVRKYKFFKDDSYKHELFLYFEPESKPEGKISEEAAKAQRAHARKIADELSEPLKKFGLISGWLEPAGQKLRQTKALVSISPADPEKNALIEKLSNLLRKEKIEEIIPKKGASFSHRIGEF